MAYQKLRQSPTKNGVPTLVINAPKSSGKKSYRQTCSTKIGSGYIIQRSQMGQIAKGSPIVVLSKDQMKRSEGIIKNLIPTYKAKNGCQRYDIHIDNLKPVIYKTESLQRTGVNVI